MEARNRILARVRRALQGRPKALLPGHPHPPSSPEALDLFLKRLGENGAEGHLVDLEGAKELLKALSQGLPGAAFGRGVPPALRLLPELPPEEAPLGVSWALFAVAETGTVALASEDGRRAQLLPPTHLVLVEGEKVYPSLLEAFLDLKALPRALGLHSGPSKSADIGQVMVKGVHGPGRLVVAVLT
ncbi:MAG: lactate utilization protein [Thermus sp.]|uniref:LutC/YkgG family protein n=1 Tax=Thermus sp. TaxID=275 RepID=UPI0025CEFB1D|nr:lactate utilization protein [Thermus sp.]MCS6869741.1 lactate utilization protein [Thermus sp.]MCS7218708.1 lactate utilization protein [Thermus sp.]MCX7850763.1 lactate utilization protein [Thermus sp.]MDW8016967.1 lactate utilization protein [Thermus sp.]MDW8358012.1 lactate utilization protein [Thermus sp.]